MTTTTPPAGMRFREYKGVTYRGDEYVFKGRTHPSAALVIAFNHDHGLDDEDHPALVALKANPLEPAPPEPVVRDATWSAVREHLEDAYEAGNAAARGNHRATNWGGLDRAADAIIRVERSAILGACGVKEQTEPTLAAQVRKAIADAVDVWVTRDAEGPDFAPADAILRAVRGESAPRCKNCDGEGWVCESHNDKPWRSEKRGGCECNAGMPCPACWPPKQETAVLAEGAEAAAPKLTHSMIVQCINHVRQRFGEQPMGYESATAKAYDEDVRKLFAGTWGTAPLTAADHVAALVAMGAERATVTQWQTEISGRSQLPGVAGLILPASAPLAPKPCDHQWYTDTGGTKCGKCGRSSLAPAETRGVNDAV